MEKRDRQISYQQIISETEGMSQEQRWVYYDTHPGSSDIVNEFKHGNHVVEGIKAQLGIEEEKPVRRGGELEKFQAQPIPADFLEELRYLQSE